MRIVPHTILSILILLTFAVGVFAGDSKREVRSKSTSPKASKETAPNAAKKADRSAVSTETKDKVETSADGPQSTQQSSLTGERIDWQVISDGGGWSTATGFQLFSVVRQTAAGTSVTDNLRLHHGFLQHFGLSSCCIGVTGNIDCDPGNVVDIADLTVLIDHMFISLNPLCCRESGNVDGDPTGEVVLADLTTLIDHLFISLLPTAACQ